MRDFHNIERSTSRTFAYIGYAVGAWRITKTPQGWRARFAGRNDIVADTLTEMSKKLDDYQATNATTR